MNAQVGFGNGQDACDPLWVETMEGLSYYLGSTAWAALTIASLM